MLAHVPNIISVTRLLVVPLVVFLALHDRMVAAFWLFVAAGISDAIDGFIAKKFNAGSVLGGFLDPLADKALLLALFVVGAHKDFFPDWLVILVVFRDALILSGAMLFHAITRSLSMNPLMISKANTAAQIALVALVLAGRGYGLDMDAVQVLLQYLVAATSVASGAAYLVKWSRLAVEIEEGKKT